MGNKLTPAEAQHTWNKMHPHVLASSKSSGSSRDSFSRATSAMGPNVTTGLRKPAAWRKNTVNLRIQSRSVTSAGQDCQAAHPLSGPLSHTLGTLSGRAGRRGPLGSSSGSSWSSEARESARSPPGRPRRFWGAYIARWRAAPL